MCILLSLIVLNGRDRVKFLCFFVKLSCKHCHVAVFLRNESSFVTTPHDVLVTGIFRFISLVF